MDERATAASVTVEWVVSDLGGWGLDVQFDLVATHYAHPAIPQLTFYQRISDWVPPGGTLLIIGHLHAPETTGHGTGNHGHGDQPLEEASVTVASVTALFDDAVWDVVTAEERTRILGDVELRDVVVRATRRA